MTWIKKHSFSLGLAAFAILYSMVELFGTLHLNNRWEDSYYCVDFVPEDGDECTHSKHMLREVAGKVVCTCPTK